jgi:hypothetical protein
MLLQKIKEDPRLVAFIETSCEENGISVSMDTRILESEYVIIKVDNYYNSLGLNPTPPSVDCLILQTCQQNEYALTIIELKDIDQTQRFRVDNVIGKFKTCFDDFITVRFREFFDNDRYYSRIKLYFVSKIDIYGSSNIDSSIKMRLLRDARIKFRGKRIPIEPRLPSPIITPC